MRCFVLWVPAADWTDITRWVVYMLVHIGEEGDGGKDGPPSQTKASCFGRERTEPAMKEKRVMPVVANIAVEICVGMTLSRTTTATYTNRSAFAHN